jgi:signal transduction histidine kinase
MSPKITIDELLLQGFSLTYTDRMTATILYILGLLLRFSALCFAFLIVHQQRSWRFSLIAFGIFWLSVQPVLQYFFSSNQYISEVAPPEVFLVTSGIALLVIYILYGVLRDNQRYEQKVTEELERSARRGEILHKLAKQRSPDLQSVLKMISAEASKELDVRRVSVWLFNESKTSIIPLILIDRGNVSETDSLHAADFPSYFIALNDDSLIVADDAREHIATREFTDTYLAPNDIHAMLDVPIRLDGEVIGIVCNEQTKSPRHWTNEDQEFAHSIADLCALAIATDRRKEISSRLEESERHLRNAQNAGQFGSFRWELHSNEIIWSGETMKELGFSETEAFSYRDLRAYMLDRDAENYDQTVADAIANHKPLLGRFTSKPEFGSKHYEVRANYEDFPEGGCFEGTIQNITDQVVIQQESQLLEAQLRQSQKMESIGTLAGGIAHDFNNILTPILGYTDIALSQVSSDSPLRETLNEVLHSSLRAKDLVEQILVFGRGWEEQREPLDIKDSITSAMKLVRPTFPASIKIDVKTTPGYKLIAADSTQMVQVLVNLCTNAWHAMEPKGGILTVNVYPFSGGESTILEVSDTGSGIDPEAAKRIFDPFYTTKDVGKGTGLGLSVVHGIISKLGAKIEVISEPDNFTTFRITFPTSSETMVDYGPTALLIEKTDS